MKRQHVSVWTGGKLWAVTGCQELAEALPDFPDPAPLGRAVLIEYYWGDMKFEIAATACSLRTTAWGDEEVTWLHCKAMRTAEIKPDGNTGMMCVLIPAHYVTRIGPGPSFRLTRSRSPKDLGVFAPNQLEPEAALSLEQIERVLVELLEPSRN